MIIICTQNPFRAQFCHPFALLHHVAQGLHLLRHRFVLLHHLNDCSFSSRRRPRSSAGSRCPVHREQTCESRYQDEACYFYYHYSSSQRGSSSTPIGPVPSAFPCHHCHLQVNSHPQAMPSRFNALTSCKCLQPDFWISESGELHAQRKQGAPIPEGNPQTAWPTYKVKKQPAHNSLKSKS